MLLVAEPIRGERAFAEKRSAEDGARHARPRQVSDGADGLAALGEIVAQGAMNTHQDALCACGSGLRSCRCCELDPTFA
jgi:hypothetical protein